MNLNRMNKPIPPTIKSPESGVGLELAVDCSTLAVVKFFASHEIWAKIVADGTEYDSTQDGPHYDSLA
jgi:hypothetical protein